MTFKRCFWLLVSILTIAIVSGIISNNNNMFYYIATVATWFLIIWCALALFKGSEGSRLDYNTYRNHKVKGSDTNG